MKAVRYQNKEFCKSVRCSKLEGGKCVDTYCVKTAKEFHHWLNENGFCLLKCKMAKYHGVDR